jgi:hypothetical protein
VEELFLGLGLALEELDVIDDEDVHFTIGLLELADVAAVERADEVVRKALDRGVARGGASPVGGDVVRDGVQKVRLAEPWRPADEQRVVGEAGHLGDRQSRGVRQTVGIADHELVEGQPGVEAPAASGGDVLAGRSLDAGRSSR